MSPAAQSRRAATAKQTQSRPSLRVVADGYQFVECRSLGHSWRHTGTIGVDDSSHSQYRRPFGASTGMIGLLSSCVECRMERVRWITRSGEVVTRYYPPDGYATRGDDVREPRQWRQSFVSAIFDGFGGSL